MRARNIELDVVLRLARQNASDRDVWDSADQGLVLHIRSCSSIRAWCTRFLFYSEVFISPALAALQSDDDELPALVTSSKLYAATSGGNLESDEFGSKTSLLSRTSVRK